MSRTATLILLASAGAVALCFVGCLGIATLALLAGSNAPKAAQTSTGDPNDPTSQPEAVQPVAHEIVTAAQVYADYANVLNAEKGYHGRKDILTGNVLSVHSSWGHPVVVLRADDFGLQQITVNLPSSFADAASRLDPGQVIDFYGAISGSGQLSITMNATDMGKGTEWAGKFKIEKLQ